MTDENLIGDGGHGSVEMAKLGLRLGLANAKVQVLASVFWLYWPCLMVRCTLHTWNQLALVGCIHILPGIIRMCLSRWTVTQSCAHVWDL